jgi:hypothetical protein
MHEWKEVDCFWLRPSTSLITHQAEVDFHSYFNDMLTMLGLHDIGMLSVQDLWTLMGRDSTIYYGNESDKVAAQVRSLSSECSLLRVKVAGGLCWLVSPQCSSAALSIQFQLEADKTQHCLTATVHLPT